MTPPISPEVTQLVESLFGERPLADRLRGHDRRPAILSRIAETRELRVVPSLLPLMATDDALAPHVARTVAGLAREMTPVQLSWLDEQVRHISYDYYRSDAWHELQPKAVSRLAQAAGFAAAVIGLLASHANGFVRAAALEVLAQDTSGQEIPFLALRANDWVEPVAVRASDLLIGRLRPDNRRGVLHALPFIVRVLGQRRRDHSGIERVLRSVLLSDRGEDALARGNEFDTFVQRKMYELLIGPANGSERHILRAALKNSDAVIRRRTIRAVATDAGFEDRAEVLERLLRDDRAPAVRRLALALLAEHLPERLGAVFPGVLLDRVASVRGLARFVARTHRLTLVPRTVYIEALPGTLPRQLAAAIDGVGETGTRADVALVAPFLSGESPRLRRSALRALATLDAEHAVSAAIAALSDDAPSVRTAAVHTLSSHASRVNFDLVSPQVSSISDPKARRNVLRVFLDAPKWDAPAFLLERLTDPDEGVRAFAARLLDRWIEGFNRNQTQPTARQLQRIGGLLDSVSSRMPEETAKMLRFSIKPS